MWIYFIKKITGIFLVDGRIVEIKYFFFTIAVHFDASHCNISDKYECLGGGFLNPVYIFCAEVLREGTEAHLRDLEEGPVHHQEDVAHHHGDGVHPDTDHLVHAENVTEELTVHQKDSDQTVIGGLRM